jgi:nucleoside-diphosphate-sugar epimerase
VKRIIFTSTVAVYGLQKADPDEESPTEPFNEYGRSKLEAEKIFDAWRKKEKERSLVIVRPVVIFGEGNKGNVYTLIQQTASNRFIMVGSGENKKSMGYVGNIVRFLVRSMRFDPGKHVFNYADKPDMSVAELVGHIRTDLGISKPYLRMPYLLGLAGGYAFDAVSGLTGRRLSISSIRIRKFCANTTVSVRALQSTGFSPPYSIREGLTRMIKSMQVS